MHDKIERLFLIIVLCSQISNNFSQLNSFYDSWEPRVFNFPNNSLLQNEPNNNPNVTIHHVGLNHDTTESGRVMYITGRGNTISYARHSVYDAIQKISFEGMIYRTDIGVF